MSVLSLVAKLLLDGTGFKAGMREAEKTAQKFGNNTLRDVKRSIAGAFSVAAVTAFAKSVIETGSRIQDLSDQFHVSVEEVQRLDFAAMQSGSTFEDWANALVKIGKARKAAAGDEGIRNTFSAFGQSWERVNSAALSNDEILRSMLQHSRGLSADARERADFDELAGKKAEKLLAILDDYRKGIPKGALISDEDVALLDKAGEALALMWRHIKAIGAGVLAGGLRRLVDTVRPNVMDVAADRTRNRGANIAEDQRRQTEEARRTREEAEKIAKAKKLYLDEIAMKEQNEILQAELRLQESLYALELRRRYGTNQRATIEQEIVDLQQKQKEAAFDIDKTNYQTMINQKQLQLESLPNAPGLAADAFQKKGILTGGSLARAAAWGNVGASPAKLGEQQVQATKDTMKAVDRLHATVLKNRVQW